MQTAFNKNNSPGFSLVELILVMAIFSIVLMATMSMYVPAVQVTAVQEQVTDVQSNLRLAMDRMTQDLLMGGFLVSDDPIIFESGTNNDPSDLTIQTRLVVNGGFGRVLSATNGSTLVVLTLAKSAMADFFPDNSKVRLYNPVDMTELASYDESNTSLAQSHVYTVSSPPSGSTVTLNHGGTLNGISNEEFGEVIIVRVRDNLQPPVQSIRYRVVDGNLQRTVNGTQVQTLSRGVNSLQFSYSHSLASGRVNKVDITMQGETAEFKGETKVRQLKSSVALRNVF